MLGIPSSAPLADWYQATIRGLYKVAQRLMTLDVTHLMRLDRDNIKLPAAPVPDYSFRFLSADDVRELALDPSSELTDACPERIRRGDQCFAALDGERLAAYAWYAYDSIEPEHNRDSSLNSGVGLTFPNDMTFMYKGFTHPDYRGRGLYGHVNARALAQLSEHGIRTVIATAEWSNRSAMTSCWRLGYRDLGKIWRGGWGQLMATIMPPHADALGIHSCQ